MRRVGREARVAAELEATGPGLRRPTRSTSAIRMVLPSFKVAKYYARASGAFTRR